MTIREQCARLLARKSSVGLLSASVMLGAFSPAIANHQMKHHSMVVQGMVTSVNSTSLQVQTSAGMVTVGLVKGVTRVVRLVTGSTGDVTPGRHVNLHLVRGTRSADVIRIDQYAVSSHHSTTGPRHVGAPSSTPHGLQSPPPSGDVASFNGNTLTLHYANGSTGAYTVTSNVNVIEALSGSFNDLGMGETVQVFFKSAGGPASKIIITNA